MIGLSLNAQTESNANPVFVTPDEIRTRFSAAMSGMYRQEVPQYGTLLDLVAEVNAAALVREPELLANPAESSRLRVERHGAIRLGTPRELHTMRRIFAVMGMLPVGYYDLSVAGVPVHSTAFRPTTESSLAANPFRVFTSLLRLELIQDAKLRDLAAGILASRNIFSERALELTEKFEDKGGLTSGEANEFVREVLHTFRWHGVATVSRDIYMRLFDAHRLIADVVSFPGPHINHLTPRTLDIDAAQAEMPRRGISAKDVIEGPPRRKVPILLRQTSFKALEESVRFPGAHTEGVHTARFGEIEQRGIALTKKGRALYDSLLQRVLDVDAADSSAADYQARLTEEFKAFADDLDTIRREGLGFFRYSLRSLPNALIKANSDINALVEQGIVDATPITYEDFLPVSAAGIFQSNLGGNASKAHVGAAAQAEFEQALGSPVLDEFALYEAEQAASVKLVMQHIGGRDGLVAELRAVVGTQGLLFGDEATPYFQGARYGNGRAMCVVRPASTQEVAQVVALCAAQGVQIIPQGANTGLVGASSPDSSGTQIVLSLTRLRYRCEIDALNRTVEADAGVLLQELNDKLGAHGLWFPIDLGANPSIGGMVSSNTGGTRLLRYGDVRHNLLALEAVLFDPPGEVARFGKPLRKNNTGFDLMQLFVGTSGAAGIITGVTVEVAPKPRQAATALLVPASDEAVAALLKAAESELGDFLTAFEGLSGSSIRAALDHVPSLRNPFGEEQVPEFTLLIELASCASPTSVLNLEIVLMGFLEVRLGHDITNAVLGRSEELWRLRHALSDGARSLGKVIGFDVSVRRADVMPFRRAAARLVASRYPELKVVDFGHVGDGGLHFNLVWPHQHCDSFDPDVVACVRDDIYDLVVNTFHGSYSAEHGVGPHNYAYYQRFTPTTAQRLSGGLQRLLDPKKVSGTVQFGPTLLT
jgi:uncharacterized glyoxalase superfamily metalloenzyme YdcJ/FAD/FMN-containing dehydrogenase